MRTQPDRRLIALVREGYENAFEEIVRRYGRSLNRYAAAIVGGRAEDVTQDAFSKALLALRRDGADIELRPWLFRIVRNTALNELRDRPPSPEVLAEAIAGGSNPAEEMERREELTDLMNRLRSLPKAQRAAIVMREMEGLSHDEIAAALGVSGGAARQAIHRARRALRNGAGMLLPLPLLKALLAASAMGPAEVAVGAAGTGGAAGAGVALKAGVATVLVAGAVGAGVAVHDGRHSGHSQERPASASPASRDATTRSAFTAPVAAIDDDRSESNGGDRGGSGERENGDDHGGRGRAPGEDHGDQQAELGDDHSGRGGREEGGNHASGGRDAGERGGNSGGGSGGGPGPSGGRDDDGASQGGSLESGSSGDGGGAGPSDGAGRDDNLASGQEARSSSGPGPGGEQQPTPEESSGSGGGPGPSSGSGSSGGSGSDGSGGDDHLDD